MANTRSNEPQVFTLNTPYPVGAVHIYTLHSVGGLVLFDTGPPTPSCFNFLKSHINLKDLKYLLITHCHADHYGAAAFIEEHSKTKIVISKNDILKHTQGEKRIKLTKEIFRSLGFPSKDLTEVESIVKSFLVNFPKNPSPLEDIATEIRTLGIDYIHCGGHSSDDIVYLTNKYAITGDILLKGIFQTPLIDVKMESGARFRSYESYCDTLNKLKKIKKYKILPGHREVSSVEEIVLFYVSKMFSRIISIKQCLNNCTVYETVMKIVKDNNPFKKFIKAGEIAFFKDFLENPELLKKQLIHLGIFDNVKNLYLQALI
ncbi:MBL fold metallo-hydrolase [Hippea jasoniae]|uniref:MBL fold metallo-hydrolase n=1 Tax=Hippea jasoniae TaxID=944479 RepID=UPI00069004FB|nr:MBL fold metallo-hydrolase [Hippea jasoniae]